MQLSDTTLQLLKNFASINSNIVIQPGSEIRTISEAKNVIATANIKEEFPQELGIYDLNEFLAVLNLVDDPELEFTKDYIKVKDHSGLSAVKYHLSEPSVLTTYSQVFKMPEPDLSFKLTANLINKLKKASSTLGNSMLQIKPDKDQMISLSVIDPENNTSNVYDISIPGKYDPDTNFKFDMQINNMKFIAGDYDVTITSKLISNFKNSDLDVQFWIALEKSSTYGE